MKKINKIIFLLFLSVLLQVTSSNAQEIQEMEVEGIKVYFQPSVKEVVSAQLFFKGGTANYSKEQEGIEALALDVVTQGGTTNNNKSQFFGRLEKVGSSIGSSNNYDYSTISLKCLAQSFDESWTLYADAINNPAFEQKEFNNAKNQRVTAAKSGESDPDTHLRNMAMANSFAGKNYAKNPEGNDTSLEALDLATVKSYYQNLKAKNKAVLVIVGNLDAATIKQKVADSFGNWAATDKIEVQETTMDIAQSSFNSESREIATNYIRGYMNAPKLGTKDEVALKVAMSILRDRYFEEVRTKRNLSYAPAAFFPSSIIKNPYLAVYVTTDKPNEAIQVMTDEIRKIHDVGFEDTELFNKKSNFLTYHYMKQETNGSLASDIGLAALSPGGLKHRENFIDLVNNLTIEDMNVAFKKYTNAINWSYLGDETIVDKDIFLAPIKKENEQSKSISEPNEKSKKKKFRLLKKKNKRTKGSNKRGF